MTPLDENGGAIRTELRYLNTRVTELEKISHECELFREKFNTGMKVLAGLLGLLTGVITFWPTIVGLLKLAIVE